MKLDVLVFAAHPDDAEIGMGGTIAKLVQEGLKVGVVELTLGELSTRGTPEIRKMETEESTKILGLDIRQNLGFSDGSIKPTDEIVNGLVSKIREFNPYVLFSPYTNDRHPDHAGLSKAAKEAFFFSGVAKYESSINGIIQEAHRPNKLFYYMQATPFEPSVIIDISKSIDEKMNSIKSFRSQFYNPNSEEPETFISKPEFIEFLEARSKFYGFQIGAKYAEPFFCDEKLEFDLVQFIKKAESIDWK